MALKKEKKVEETTIKESTDTNQVSEIKDKKEEKVKLNKSQQDLINRIDAKREVFKGHQTKQKKINYLVTIIFVLVLVGAFAIMLLLANQNVVFLILGIGLVVASLVGTYIVTKIMHKNLTEKANDYIDYLFEETSAYIYKSEETKEFFVESKGKLDDQLFFDAHLYKELKNTKSRNLTHFKLNDCFYEIADLAANTLVKNKLAPKFLGKFYSVKVPCNYKHTIIFQMKGNNLSVPIDDVDGLNLIDNNDVYLMYSDDAKCTDVFDKHALQIIKKIKIADPVIDIIVSIKGERISVGIDYVDDYLSIPVDNAYNLKYAIKTKADWEIIQEFVNLLENNLKELNSKKTK